MISLSTVKKLHACNAGSFKIMRKSNSYAYIVHLSYDFDISLFFNIKDLVAYKGSNFSPNNPLLAEPFPASIFEGPLSPPLTPIQPNCPA